MPLPRSWASRGEAWGLGNRGLYLFPGAAGSVRSGDMTVGGGCGMQGDGEGHALRTGPRRDRNSVRDHRSLGVHRGAGSRAHLPLGRGDASLPGRPHVAVRSSRWLVLLLVGGGRLDRPSWAVKAPEPGGNLKGGPPTVVF